MKVTAFTAGNITRSASVLPEFLQKILYQDRPRIFFTGPPFIDLGPRLDVAARAIGSTELIPLQAAFGWIVVAFRDVAGNTEAFMFRRIPEHIPAFDVEMFARRTAVRDQSPVWVGRAIGQLGRKTLFILTLQIHPEMEGSDLADLVDKSASPDSSDLLKILDPGKDRDFVRLNQRLARMLKRGTDPIVNRALEKILQGLDVDFTKLTLAQQNALIDRVVKAWNPVPASVARIVNLELKQDLPISYDRNRQGEIKRHDLRIELSTSLADKAIKNNLVKDEVNFARNFMGVRQDEISARARLIVGRGVQAGLGQAQIAEDLNNGLRLLNASKQNSYWPVIANVFQNRARTFSSFRAYQDGGLEKAEIVAVLDEATTDVCRLMDGKIIIIGEALDNFAAASKLEDPEEIKLRNPFLRIRRDGDKRLIQVDHRSSRAEKPVTTTLATIAESGLGTQKPGRYTNQISVGAIQATGVGGPPYHGRCRTTTVPVP